MATGAASGPASGASGAAPVSAGDGPGVHADGPAADDGALVEPMSASLMAKLFGVPLLIVTLIVGSAVVVVLLFGAIATESERSIDALLTVLDRDPGSKVFGVAMMPQDKEIWQAGRELALRLEKKDSELTDAQLDKIVSRLTALVDRELARTGPMPEDRLEPLHFFLAALSHTGRAEAVAPMLRCLASPHWQTRREALKAIANLHDLPRAHAEVGRVAACLEDANTSVRTVAAVVLSVIARPGDTVAVAALKNACLGADQDREVRWNAALSLARLGDASGRGVLLDMLDRRFWTERAKVRLVQPGGVVMERPMPPAQIEGNLMAAVEAGAHLQDAEVWSAIQALSKDPSIHVQEAVRKVLAARIGVEAGGSG